MSWKIVRLTLGIPLFVMLSLVMNHLSSLDRNGCDAVLNAYTALLHSQERTDMLGSPDEGMLVLPGLPR